jgi:hypothetical protein
MINLLAKRQMGTVLYRFTDNFIIVDGNSLLSNFPTISNYIDPLRGRCYNRAKVGIGDGGLGTGDWGLGTGDWGRDDGMMGLDKNHHLIIPSSIQSPIPIH